MIYTHRNPSGQSFPNELSIALLTMLPLFPHFIIYIIGCATLIVCTLLIIIYLLKLYIGTQLSEADIISSINSPSPPPFPTCFLSH